MDNKARTNINWKDYESPKFIPHIPNNRPFYKNCGSAIVSLITGESPEAIEQKRPEVKRGMPSAVFSSILRAKGYTVITVAKNNVTQIEDTSEVRCWENLPLNSRHVLAMNIHVTNKENSMFLLNRNELWHHFDPIPFDPMFFLNKPTQDVMLIWHPLWSDRPAIELDSNCLTRCCM